MESDEKKFGTVKWFSNDKGYGFITDINNVDYYFSVREIIGATLPANGAKVNFQPIETPKGKQAKAIEIIEQPKNNNSYVTCLSCQKRMVPRIIYEKSMPMRSICPFCGSQYKNLMTLGRFILSLLP